jgi:ribosomal-protein-alanine N-acetyltransferase
MIGQVTLSRLEGDRLWGLAFWIHPDHWCRGYATEGAGRILAFGFMELEAEKIWAGAGDWNRASCRVLEKIGMIYVGGNPQGYSSSGEPVRTREYAISRKSWQKKSKTKYGEG